MINEPFLLFHDEISIGATPRSGVLTCAAGSNISVWRNVAAVVIDSNSSIYQTVFVASDQQRLYRVSGVEIPIDSFYNGLWSCIQEDQTEFFFIGIYHRAARGNEGKNIHTKSECWGHNMDMR